MNLEGGIYLRPWSVEARAEHLLRRHLSPEQLHEWLSNRGFWAVGNVTGIRYFIRDSGSANIGIDGRHFICVGPSYDLRLPLADRLFVQKLYIEHAEDKLLAALNLTAESIKELQNHFRSYR